MTDGNPSYAKLDEYFCGHHAVRSQQRVCTRDGTNFAESYRSLLKRGLIGAIPSR
jgi:hypothetical protein